MKLILATVSPYRIEAFKKLGIDFIVEGSNVDEENAERSPDPEVLTQHLATLKAQAVAQRHQDGIIIGFDSVAWYNGRTFDRPTSREEDFARLKGLSGGSYEYCTGIHIINLYNGKTLTSAVRTKATMRKYTDEEINRYMDHCDDKYLTHAHGFNPEHYYSMSFVESLSGDPFNFILAVPMGKITGMLQEIGFTLL